MGYMKIPPLFSPIISDISFTSNAGLSLGTTGIPVISRQSLRVLRELIQLDLDIKTIVTELVYVFLDLFNLAFHAFVVFFYVTPLLCPKYEKTHIAD